MDEPMVSVLLACRDAARHLPQALAGIDAQTYRKIELIAVDDGSVDGTAKILRAFASGRPWVRVLRGTASGPAAARALAERESTGSYIAIHDADDLSLPERFERQVDYLTAHPDVGVLGTAADVIDDDGATIGRHPVPLRPVLIRRVLRRAPPFVNGSVMMRRDAYEAAGGFRPGFRVAEDYDLWLRVPRRFELRNLETPLYRWRLHDANTFRRQRDAHLEYLALARAFAEERRRTGSDSAEALRHAPSLSVFRASYAGRATLARFHGEALIREGRTAEGRAALREAFGARAAGTRSSAVAWWLLSWPVGLTPRARRRRAEARSRSTAKDGARA